MSLYSEIEIPRCYRCPHKYIRKAFELITHPITKNHYGRQLEVIKLFLESTNYAFYLRDISHIISVFEHLTRELDNFPEFRRPLKELYHYAGTSPILVKPSEISQYRIDLIQYFTTIGFLIMCYKKEIYSSLAIDALLGLLKDEPLGTNCLRKEVCYECAESSQLPEIIGKILPYLSEELYSKILEVVILLGEYSPTISQRIAQQNALEFILRRLEPGWSIKNGKTTSRQLTSMDIILNVDKASKCLWLIFKSLRNLNQNLKKPSKLALRSLQYCFRCSSLMSSIKGFHLRNNFACFILVLMRYFTELNILDIVLLATFTELGAKGTWAEQVIFQRDTVGYHFKKILLTCLIFFKKHHAIQYIANKRVLYSFINLSLPSTGWPVPHQCGLLTYILRIIYEIIPFVINDLPTEIVPKHLLQIAEYYLIKPCDVNILNYCMSCICRITLHNYLELNSFILRHKGIEVITDILLMIFEQNVLRMSHQKILAYGFFTLQYFCSAYQLTSSNNIKLSFVFMERLLNSKPNDPLMDSKVAICGLHYIWSLIDQFKNFTISFEKKGGVYLLLDITRVCSKSIRVITLGAIADICYHDVGILNLITWRNQNFQILSLLMDNFKGSNINPITSISFIREFNLFEPIESRTVCTDLISDKNEFLMLLRPKVYSILYVLFEKYAKKVQIANENYRLFNEELSIQNQIFLLFAKNYLSLEICKVWVEVIKNIHEEVKGPGLKLTEEDKLGMKDMTDLIVNWRRILLERAEISMCREKQLEQIREVNHYHKLKESTLSSALYALEELCYIARCTVKMYRNRKKLRDEMTAHKHLRQSNENFHKLFVDHLAITALYEQYISIESNVIIDVNAPVFDLPLVSPEGSQMSLVGNVSEESVIMDDMGQCE